MKLKTIKRYLNNLSNVIFVAGLMIGAWQARGTLAPVYAMTTVEVPTYVTSTSTAPVMDRIAKCESNGSQYDKNGQVIYNYNPKSDSFDIGRYQINVRMWGAKAKSMNLDLTKELDNAKMAMWIYENRGTQDWYSSANCWNK